MPTIEFESIEGEEVGRLLCVTVGARLVAQLLSVPRGWTIHEAGRAPWAWLPLVNNY